MKAFHSENEYSGTLTEEWSLMGILLHWKRWDLIEDAFACGWLFDKPNADYSSREQYAFRSSWNMGSRWHSWLGDAVAHGAPIETIKVLLQNGAMIPENGVLSTCDGYNSSQVTMDSLSADVLALVEQERVRRATESTSGVNRDVRVTGRGCVVA
jgi:hypothetical protein